MDDKTEIPLSWRLTKLGDLGEVNRGRSRHRPRYASHLYNGPYPFIQTGDIKNSDGRISEYQQTYSEAGLAQSRLWPKGTMCVTIAANIAETAILNFPACFPDSIVGFIADESKCETRFVEYTFRNLKARIQHEATGSVQDNINLATLDRLRFPLPPLLEQHAIAEILGILDDKIEHNRQMNRTLEAMARAVFNAWFVDFDPVQAKAAGRQSFPGMPQGVFEQLPDRFIETEFGSVPEGWTYVPIGELVDVIGGGTPSTKNPDFWRGGKFPFCTPKDMSRLASPALLETERHITQAGVDKISSGQLPVGTVILSSRAPIGYLALAEMPISVNQGIIAMITGEIPNTYVLLWTEANMEVIKSRAGGSTFAEISKRNFRPILTLRPDDCTLSAFGDVVQPLFELIASNEQQVRVLAAIRDTLLPKLISGELRVPAAEESADYG